MTDDDLIIGIIVGILCVLFVWLLGAVLRG
jgi:hypothetical protein